MLKYKLAQSYVPEAIIPFDEKYESKYFKFIIGTHPGTDENNKIIPEAELEDNPYQIRIKAILESGTIPNDEAVFYYRCKSVNGRWFSDDWVKFSPNNSFSYTIGTSFEPVYIYIIGNADLSYSSTFYDYDNPTGETIYPYYDRIYSDYSNGNGTRYLGYDYSFDVECRIGSSYENSREANDMAYKMVKIGGSYGSLFSGVGPRPYCEPSRNASDCNINMAKWNKRNASAYDSTKTAPITFGNNISIDKSFQLCGEMKEYCYKSFFEGNTNITSASIFQTFASQNVNLEEYPSWKYFSGYDTIFADQACYRMYYGCTSLSSAEIPFIWSMGTDYMVSNAFDQAFYQCRNLRTLNIHFYDVDSPSMNNDDNWYTDSRYLNGAKNNAAKLLNMIGEPQYSSAGDSAGDMSGIFGVYVNTTNMPGYNHIANEQTCKINFYNAPSVPTIKTSDNIERYNLDSNILSVYTKVNQRLYNYYWDLYLGTYTIGIDGHPVINSERFDFKWNYLTLREMSYSSTDYEGNNVYYENAGTAEHTFISFLIPINDPIRTLPIIASNENIDVSKPLMFGNNYYLNSTTGTFLQGLLQYNNVETRFSTLEEWRRLKKISIRIKGESNNITIWGVKIGDQLLAARTTVLPRGTTSAMNNVAYNDTDRVVYENNKCNLVIASESNTLKNFRKYNTGDNYSYTDFIIKLSTVPSDLFTFV